jgi:hypothetical protein
MVEGENGTMGRGQNRTEGVVGKTDIQTASIERDKRDSLREIHL